MLRVPLFYSKIIEAGMELSEYVMPGLGGTVLSEEHARETADALNRINPHFIRLKTLTIPPGYQLFNEKSEIKFKKVETICNQFQITPENVDEVIDHTIQRTM